MDFEREICMRIHLERLLQTPEGIAAVAADGHAGTSPQDEPDAGRVRRDCLDIRTDAWEGVDPLGQAGHPSRWIAAFLSDHAQLLFTLSDSARVLTGLCVDFEVGREGGAPLATVTTRERLATLPNGVRARAEVARVSVAFATPDDAPATVHPWDVMAMVLDSVEQNTNATAFVLDHEVGRLPENEHFRVRPSARHGECLSCRRCGRSWSCAELTAEQWAAGCPAPDCPGHAAPEG